MSNDVQAEFTKISHQVFYFDTNVISYIYNHAKIINESLKQKATIAYVLLTKYKNKKNSAFPYSFDHLRDIYFGSEEYQISKIEELKQHSDCWKIQNDSNSQLVRMDKCLDIDADYRYLKSGMNESKNIQDGFQEFRSVFRKPVSFSEPIPDSAVKLF